MRAFLATVLSVIAVGVMVIAYGLVSPRIAATAGYQPQGARPMLAGERVELVDDTLAPATQYVNYPAYSPAYTIARPAAGYRVNDVRAVPAVYETAPAPERIIYREPQATRTVTRVERAPRR